MKIVLIAVVVAAIVYFFYRQGKQVTAQSKVADLSHAKVEIIEGELKMADVVSIFKSMNLSSSVHTPFIAANLNGFDVKPENSLNKTGYTPLVLGIYNEDKAEAQFMEIVFAKSFDESLQKALATATSENPIVVLS